jgi:riboflavin kinase/FMN adenylyltransferase
VRVLDWEEFATGSGLGKPISATVGVFDGLHMGHRRLVEKVFAHAGGRLSCVLTFRDSPKRILHPASWHGALSTLDQKLEALDSTGLDVCVLIDFSGNFSKLAGRDFLSVLREKGDLEYIAVGSNFSCGYRLDTHASDIKAYYSDLGVEAEVVEPVLWGGHPVSSSRIRHAVMDGRLGEAKAMMGRSYEVDLRGIRVLRSEAGHPACERPSGIVLPPLGRYDAVAMGGEGPVPIILGVREGGLVFEGCVDRTPLRVAIDGLTQK